MHQTRGKNGAIRPTNVADAKKSHLYPSVTTILNLVHKPALFDWISDQLLFAAYRNPPARALESQEDFSTWKGRIKRIGGKEARDAASLGSRIHDSVYRHFVEERKVLRQFMPYVQPVIKWHKVHKEVEILEREIRTVDSGFGFAGTVDALGFFNGDKPLILDYKSRNTKPDSPPPIRDDDALQLAAYAMAVFGEEWIEDAVGYSFIISSTEPGRIHVKVYEDLAHHFYDGFLPILRSWIYITGYNPGQMRNLSDGDSRT